VKEGRDTSSSFSGISGDPTARGTVLTPTLPRVAGGRRHKYLLPAAASGQVANFMRDDCGLWAHFDGCYSNTVWQLHAARCAVHISDVRL